MKPDEGGALPRATPDSFEVQLEGICKAYPGVTALEDVSLRIGRGEVVGLAGRNGAGKSTLIKILAGAVQPDRGTIRIGGAPVVIASPLDATRRGLAFVHQELSDIGGLSVAENVFIGLGYPRRFGRLINKRALHRRTREVLDRLGSDIRPEATVRTLGVADQRLVMIARGLAADASLLVMDEPTASLTATEVDGLHEVVELLASSGVALLYVSHRLDDMAAVVTRTVVLRNGRVVMDQPSDMADRGGLISAITGTEHRAGISAPAQRGTQTGEELLEVKGLGRAGVVHDASFTVRAGEVLGFAGLVGAGRTELARLVFGADRASTGTISVRGVPVKISSPHDAIAHGIGYLPEDRRGQGLALEHSVRANLTLGALKSYRRLRQLPLVDKHRERARAEELVKELEIRTPDAERPVRWLSGGNQQKVVVGRWTERDAEVLFFDEPTHGVDLNGKAEFHGLMRDLALRGKGIVFISSDFDELTQVCDRVLVLREGRIVAELSGTEIDVPQMVEMSYGGGSEGYTESTGRPKDEVVNQLKDTESKRYEAR